MRARVIRAKSCSLALGVALVLGVALAPALAVADDDSGLHTGRGHMVRVVASASIGLEAGIPRDSSYGKALEHDMQGRYYNAYRLFLQAQQEFRAQQQKRPFDKRIADWITKAQQQANLSNSLNHQTQYKRRPYWRNSYYNHYSWAYNLHQKWLALRAFGLDAPQKLALEAVKGYKDALRLRYSTYRRHSQYPEARLNLAGLLYELGHTAEAEQTFRQVSRPFGYAHWIPLAYYYSVVGRRREAIGALKGATHGSNTWRRNYIYPLSFFDGLRGDPAFEQLFGRR